MSFQSAALSTPEILNLILAELSMRCLITTAQRVCREWRDAIMASPALQQKLFFRPLPELTQAERQLNPVLQKAFSPWFEPHRFPQQMFNAAAEHVFDELPVDLYSEAFLRKGASWRRMLVQQPPVVKLGILNVFINIRFETARVIKKWASFDEDGGLRMGPLYDLSQAWLGTPKHYCQLAWWELPTVELLKNKKTWKAIKTMLETAGVVLQRQLIGAAPMQSPMPNSEWLQKFRSEDFDVVDVVFDEEEEDEEEEEEEE